MRMCGLSASRLVLSSSCSTTAGLRFLSSASLLRREDAMGSESAIFFSSEKLPRHLCIVEYLEQHRPRFTDPDSAPYQLLTIDIDSSTKTSRIWNGRKSVP
ncbi:uncharacterized protein LOC144616045 [Panthera onca]